MGFSAYSYCFFVSLERLGSFSVTISLIFGVDTEEGVTFAALS